MAEKLKLELKISNIAIAFCNSIANADTYFWRLEILALDDLLSIAFVRCGLFTCRQSLLSGQ
jgi:hypothetical protein